MKAKNFSYVSFFAMLALMTVGTLAIHSAGHARAETIFHEMWKSNLQTAVFGLVIYFILAFIDYRKILDLFAWPLYGISLSMLLAVLKFGGSVYGGQRWLWFFQPSEIAKFCLIALISALIGHTSNFFTSLRSTFRGFLIAAGLVGVPALLILKEPDLGTTLALIPAVLVMFFVAKVWRTGLLFLVIFGSMAASLVIGAVYEAEKPGVLPERREQILKYTCLRPHQVKRIKVFLFPQEDTLGAGYNLRQAMIAIGSGGFSGKGFGKAETNRLQYLPVSVSMNDFIFCVYAEEFGFLGSLALLGLYLLLLLPCCYVAYAATDMRGRLFALGFSTLIFAHVYVNIGMSVGLLPITGLPLPFISSGRTFLVVCLVGFGFIQSISLHREDENMV